MTASDSEVECSFSAYSPLITSVKLRSKKWQDFERALIISDNSNELAVLVVNRRNS